MALAAQGLDIKAAAFGGIGPPEVIIVLFVVLLLFGGRKLPEIARGTGRALRIFKSETKGLMTDDDDDMPESESKRSQSQLPPASDQPVAKDPSAPSSSETSDPLPPTHTEK
jgi:sec-independent protein translocase protein TatA